MRIRRVVRLALRSIAPLALLAPALALAHAFVQPYTLPVPFSMYAFGAGAALALSFVIVGVFVGAPSVGRVRAGAPQVRPVHQTRGAGQRVGSAISLALLVLCIATGLFGTQNPFANINMTLFWIVFVLGVPYLCAFVGDVYAPVNPWAALVGLIARLTGIGFGGRRPYPAGAGYWPALGLYMAFIWLELFGNLRPYGLSIALLSYTLINIAGAWRYGVAAWFEYGEFFGVLMRLIGAMSPWTPSPERRAPADRAGRRWRAPFRGLMELRATHLSLVLFILFMLSSTAFDGLHSTIPWVAVFWKGIYPSIQPWLTSAPKQQYALSAQLYYGWQWLALLLSPVVYFVVLAAFVQAAKSAIRCAVPLRELVLRFAVSLVPIAFVYHVTHYYTLLLSQGGQIVRLVSDPFGVGWNLFGTGRMNIAPIMVSMDAIWHTQVALILAGHIVSVYLAHLEALQLFPAPRAAALSQLPLLVLMVLFTTLGLWILSLPIAGG